MEVVTIADIRLPSDEMYQILKMVVPWNHCARAFGENVLRPRRGRSLLWGELWGGAAIADGGFRIDTEFSPASLGANSAKMDGAIILGSEDARRIVRGKRHAAA